MISKKWKAEVINFWKRWIAEEVCGIFQTRKSRKVSLKISCSRPPQLLQGHTNNPGPFCVVKDPEIRKQIRIAAEKEERESYDHRMTEEWLKDLEPIGTDWNKPFLEIAPYLIVVFKRSYEIEENNHKHQNYYVTESCGIACGFLLAAIHHAGLVALTHTPSPMNFLSKILNRPINEKPFLLIPVGYPVEECWVPDIKRKGISEICNWI